MNAAEIAKQTGNKSVKEVSQVTATPKSTLYDMATNYPARYKALCIGAAVMKYGLDHLLQERMKQNLHRLFPGEKDDTDTEN